MTLTTKQEIIMSRVQAMIEACLDEVDALVKEELNIDDFSLVDGLCIWQDPHEYLENIVNPE